MWQQGILLSLVEAMDLIDKQKSTFAMSETLQAGFFNDGANLLHSSEDGTERDKVRVGLGGDDLSQGSFPSARRRPQNYRGQAILFDRPPQEFSLPQQVRLSNELLEREGSHPLGQWRMKRRYLSRRFLEKIHDFPLLHPSLMTEDLQPHDHYCNRSRRTLTVELTR
jgi:hypothetical protein